MTSSAGTNQTLLTLRHDAPKDELGVSGPIGTTKKMSLFNAIKSAVASEKTQTNADKAKQRLHVLLISDRGGFNKPDFLPKLRLEIIAVLQKYLPDMDSEDVEIKYDSNDADGTHILEMSVALEGSGAQKLNISAGSRQN